MKTEKKCAICKVPIPTNRLHKLYCGKICRKHARISRMDSANCGKCGKKYKVTFRKPKNCPQCNMSHNISKALSYIYIYPHTRSLSSAHFKAIEGLIRDPRGVVHYFCNATKFVKENEHLFFPEDVIWKAGKTSNYCRAYNGIIQVYSGRKGTWKGWTLVSDVEIKEHGWDILRRKYREDHPD